MNEGNMKTVSFKKTPPMPSYLIALIVGDFDKTEITGLSVPGYIYSPKSLSALKYYSYTDI